MAELDPAFSALARLHRALVEPEALEATLDRIVALVTDGVPGCDLASVTAATSRPVTVAFSEPEVQPLDDAQYASGGPCVHAYESRETVRIDDLAVEPRWAEFRTAAHARGINSSLSQPLLVDERALGSINLYGRVPAAFDDRSERIGRLFAEQAAIALANAVNSAELRELAEQLRDGMRYRDVIGQAKGILMAQRRITADEAFEVLRETSQRLNRKVRDLAQDLATTGQLPG